MSVLNKMIVRKHTINGSLPLIVGKLGAQTFKQVRQTLNVYLPTSFVTNCVHSSGLLVHVLNIPTFMTPDGWPLVYTGNLQPGNAHEQDTVRSTQISPFISTNRSSTLRFIAQPSCYIDWQYTCTHDSSSQRAGPAAHTKRPRLYIHHYQENIEGELLAYHAQQQTCIAWETAQCTGQDPVHACGFRATYPCSNVRHACVCMCVCNILHIQTKRMLPHSMLLHAYGHTFLHGAACDTHHPP